jgi:hypothetical protein
MPDGEVLPVVSVDARADCGTAKGARGGALTLRMAFRGSRTICWAPTWNPQFQGVGLEHVTLDDGHADSVLLAVDEDGEPFRLTYRLQWDDRGALRRADLESGTRGRMRALRLHVGGDGRWLDAEGRHLAHLDGCVDIDIWPTPLTNSLPIWRSALAVGERREYRMAWVAAPALTVEARPQAYTRLDERSYLFESLDGSGFTARLPVDDDGFVVDYPGLFRRVVAGGA